MVAISCEGADHVTIVNPEDRVFARNDNGVIRCGHCDEHTGHPDCDMRFGEIQARLGVRYALIDAGWNARAITSNGGEETPVITLNGYNRKRLRGSYGELRDWRAKPQADRRGGRPRQLVLADLLGTSWIDCPFHGFQQLSHSVLGTHEWFEDELEPGFDLFTPRPDEDAASRED